jgi:hypothetical protein
MRSILLLATCLITNCLFAQKLLKGLYHSDGGELKLLFDGKGNFEITKPSYYVARKGCGIYTLNDSQLILEYISHPADTPLYKSDVKYFGLPTNDSIDVMLNLIDIDFPDTLQSVYAVYTYSSGSEESLKISSSDSGKTVHFKLPATTIPCILEADSYYFLYGKVEITQANNAEIKIYAKLNTTGIYGYIPAGKTEKYPICHFTSNSFYLTEYWHTSIYKRQKQ